MNYIGINVTKAKMAVLCLEHTDQQQTKAQAFSHNLNGFKQLVGWLADSVAAAPAQMHIVMAATGVDHEALAYFLHERGYVISVIAQAHIRQFAAGLGMHDKADRQDGLLLARYGAQVQPPAWQPAPKPVRQLKVMVARVDAFEVDLQREEDDLAKAEDADMLDSILASGHDAIQFFKQAIAKLMQDINDHIEAHPDLKKDLSLLESIPGIGTKVALKMLVLIRGQHFESASQLAAFVGLVPKRNESGSTTLSKNGSSEIRALLYFPALVAVQHSELIKAQYQRLLQAGKTKMQAIAAVMRKLVQLCFGVLKHQMPFRDDHYQTA